MFTILLIVVTCAVASAAAYFSVYGLAATFSGAFWSVTAMGVSLEAAKLMAASYLYRYWERTNLALKTYLLLGTAALMLLTSVGIFGYLSAGYQQDVLPLKAKKEAIALQESERERLLTRKQEIDRVLSGGPALDSVGTGGRIDPNAAKTIRELSRSKESTTRQFRTEQESVNARIQQLDVELLALKQEILKVEAHTGPIIFIAEAFGQTSDSAIKWLILIIVIAFDPMAVALTLAVNNVMRLNQMPTTIQPEPEPEPELPVHDTRRKTKPYPLTSEGGSVNNSLRELIEIHKMLKAKQDRGETLSQDERWDMAAIEQALRTHGGIDLYLD